MRQIRQAVRLAVLAATVLLVGGCGREAKAPAPDGRRIFSAAGAATAVLLALDAPELVAVDDYGRLVPGAEALPTLGRGETVALEKVLELKITTAIVWYYQQQLRLALEQRGIEVITLPPQRLATYPDTVRQLGKLTGRDAEAERLAADFAAALPPPPANGPKARVYFELYAPLKTAGDASYIGDLLKLAGAENIAGVMPVPSGPISAEAVVEAAPEVIFHIAGFTAAAEIAARPGFAALPAVRDGRIYAVDRRCLIEGVDPAAAVRLLRQKIYGE